MFRILKRAGVDYTERRLLYKLYQKETAVIRVGETEEEACIKKRIRQGCTFTPSIFKCIHPRNNRHDKKENPYGYKAEWKEN